MLLAVNVNGNCWPACWVEAVPESVAVLVLKVIPAGNVPVIAINGAGAPLAVTVNEKATFDTAIAEATLVNAGTLCTVSVKACVDAPAALVAVNVTGNCWPAVVVAAVPESVAVAASKVMPIRQRPCHRERWVSARPWWSP